MSRDALRLCIVSEFFHPESSSGTGKAVTDIARKLVADHGFSVDVVCGRRSYLTGELFEPASEWNGLRIRRLNFPNWNRSGVAKRSLANLILALKAGWTLWTGPKYDAVLVTTAPPFLPMAARWLWLRKRTPYFYLIYDLEPDRAVRLGAVKADARPTRMLKKAQSKWLKSSAKVIAIGRCMKDLISREYGIEPGRIEVVPVGADGSANEPTQRTSTQRPFRLTYSGNLGRYHDFDSLLDCAKRFDPDEIQIKIVGLGAKRAHIESRVKGEAISSVLVSDPLPSDEYHALLAATDVCLVTMEAGIEGTCVPSKFYSILGAGRCTLAVANEDTELARTIMENDCGVRVSPGDTEALYRAIMDLFQDRIRCIEQGRNAYVAYRDRYTTDRSVAQLASIISESVEAQNCIKNQ